MNCVYSCCHNKQHIGLWSMATVNLVYFMPLRIYTKLWESMTHNQPPGMAFIWNKKRKTCHPTPIDPQHSCLQILAPSLQCVDLILESNVAWNLSTSRFKGVHTSVMVDAIELSIEDMANRKASESRSNWALSTWATMCNWETKQLINCCFHISTTSIYAPSMIEVAIAVDLERFAIHMWDKKHVSIAAFDKDWNWEKHVMLVVSGRTVLYTLYGSRKKIGPE